MKNVFKPVVLSAAVLFSGAALADKDDVRLLAETKITLVEAINIAEKHQNGRAYEASLDDKKFTPVYEVNVVVGDVIYEIDVDGVTGEVRKVKVDD